MYNCFVDQGGTAVVVHDIRGTLRLMRTQPVMSAAIVLMLALGISATTAIFSVVYGVLLRPLPFPEPERKYRDRGRTAGGTVWR
jgi:hypothetical protein